MKMVKALFLLVIACNISAVEIKVTNNGKYTYKVTFYPGAKTYTVYPSSTVSQTNNLCYAQAIIERINGNKVTPFTIKPTDKIGVVCKKWHFTITDTEAKINAKNDLVEFGGY